MEIYEAIRHLKEREHLGQRDIAKRLKISRNTVAKYWDGETVPWERKEGTGKTCSVITDEVKEFITECLSIDEESGLKKQQHTAKRIYDRLVDEKKFTGGESSVRRLVAELRNRPGKAFIPLEYEPGESSQVDWGEATVYISEEKIKINIWCMRECFSDDFICQAFLRQNEESFLEGMRGGLEYFEGVPRRIIFDNAKVAVKEGFGLHAKTTDKYYAMSAHYAFEPVFCNIAAGHEKGLVEGLVGFVRRNTLVPIPHVESIEELNALLLAASKKYQNHHVEGKPAAVGEMTRLYKKKMIPLPPYRFDTSRTQQMKVDDFSLVRFDHNKYSVPYTLVGKKVTVKGYGNNIKIIYENTIAAEYVRDYAHSATHYRLEHYIDLIEKRPRSVYNAAPIKNTVPPMLNDFLSKLNNPKDVIKVLRLYLEQGDKICDLVSSCATYEALSAKLIDVDLPKAVRYDEEIKVSAPNLKCYDKLMRIVNR